MTTDQLIRKIRNVNLGRVAGRRWYASAFARTSNRGCRGYGVSPNAALADLWREIQTEDRGK